MLLRVNQIFKGYTLRIIAALGLIVVLILTVVPWVWLGNEGAPNEMMPTKAHIVSIRPEYHIYRPGCSPSIVIVAQSPSGNTGRKTVPIEQVVGLSLIHI